MKIRTLLATGILAVLFTGTSALAAEKWHGPYIGFESAFAQANVDYSNTGTPEQNIDGGMFGAVVGYDHRFDNFVIGLTADVLAGTAQDFVRDGNYITESGKVPTVATIRGRFGVAFGDTLFYGTGGVMLANLEQGEVCPSPAAAPFGFCHTHGAFDLKGSKWQTAPVIGGGIEHAFAPGFSLQVQYLHGFFPATDYVLGPDGIGSPLPVSTTHMGVDLVTAALIKRF